MIDNGNGTMDRQTFEEELRRDGYEPFTSTTTGAKTNPDHSHPFDADDLREIVRVWARMRSFL